jgi:hypothetical protein
LACGPTPQCEQGPFVAALAGPCTDLAAPVTIQPTDYCRVTPPAVAPGSCAPTGGAIHRPAPTFTKLSRVCSQGRTGGGCDAAHVCVASPAGSAHGVCVAQPVGTASLCPAGFTHGHTVSLDGGVTDTRACGACSCSAPVGAACGGVATLHALPECTEPDAGALPGGTDPTPPTITTNGLCQTGLVVAAETFASLENAPAVTTPGTCKAAGGQLSGTATVTDQTQICCQN